METDHTYYYNYFIDVIVLLYGAFFVIFVISLIICAILLATIVRILPTVALGFRPSFAVAFRANLIAGIAVFLFSSIVVVFLLFVLNLEPEELSESHALAISISISSILVSVVIWAASVWRFFKGPDGRHLSAVRALVLASFSYFIWWFCFFTLGVYLYIFLLDFAV